MKFLRGLLLSLVTSAASGLVVVGAMLAAVSEGLLVQLAPELPTEIIPLIEETYEPGVPTATRLPTRTSAPVTRLTNFPTICPRPAGWLPYTVLGGDTAGSLSEERAVTLSQLLQANCLLSPGSLIPGVVIFLPPVPTPKPSEPTATLTPSRTPLRCGPPPGWIQYRVRSGDTLFKIATAYGTSVPDLKFANCMGSSDQIITGDLLYVPNVTPRFPTSTRTPLPTFTSPPPATRTFTATSAPPTATHTPVTRTATPPTGTSTTVPSSTSTNTVAPTLTATPTVPTPTPTPVPTK